MKKAISVLLLTILSASCIKIDQFEKTVQIPTQEWFYNNIPTFTFHITDTTSPYNLYIVLRHTDSYDYKNIWLRLGSALPGDSMRFQNIDVTLASDANGWDGSGMDDIFEVRKNISRGPVPFKKAGDYTFSVAQIMRENPLQHVMNVGIRVEKISKQ
ncbi:MAG: gliding motility lipoprotein GldH [Bacteroidota bacterium]|nr:gliding motility lipoprotein GldH [Bacteroidota bacterium]MDQ6888813.1 gliding motility lipoprotein GldH [Bacteroidota bacterium]